MTDTATDAIDATEATDATDAIDATEALVRRLARPHPSGGVVIERSVIIAEGSRSATILRWISEHEGIGDSATPSTREPWAARLTRRGPTAGRAGETIRASGERVPDRAGEAGGESRRRLTPDRPAARPFPPISSCI